MTVHFFSKVPQGAHGNTALPSSYVEFKGAVFPFVLKQMYKMEKKPGMVTLTSNPSTGEAQTVDLQELEAGLVYILSFRPVGTA